MCWKSTNLKCVSNCLLRLISVSCVRQYPKNATLYKQLLSKLSSQIAMEENKISNFYDVLQCERTASNDELKKNYQRLVLFSHPDKCDSNEDRFLIIQKAWSVLRDPETRKQYDATLTCQEHSELLLYDTIKLVDMVYDEDEKIYTYNCRCGGIYSLDGDNSALNTIVIGCDECSFSIQVYKQ